MQLFRHLSLIYHALTPEQLQFEVIWDTTSLVTLHIDNVGISDSIHQQREETDAVPQVQVL